MAKQDRFIFRKLDTIGAAAAEEDTEFLKECFVEHGYIDVLKNCKDSRRILLGRTGSGKTALLHKLMETEERCIEIKPESLALAYVSNSTIIQFVSELGVDLDIFFKLLWRHVFAVELLKQHFGIDTEDAKLSVITQIRLMFKGKKHQLALEYLDKWGRSFWEETDNRIKELTTTLEQGIMESIKGKIPGFSLSSGDTRTLTEQQKSEVVQRAQHVVNEVQIRQLSDVIDLLDDILKDPQKRYYLTIDRLDEHWVEDKTRYRLIRALIETVRDFRKIRHVKILIAIRYDLLSRVIKLTRDAGFQEEKYLSLYLPIEWTKDNLISVLDHRINYLVKRRYTSSPVGYKDVLPEKVKGEKAISYILERTLLRPRDAIVFFNNCIKRAADRPIISATMIRDAEGEYSKDRLRALADEWNADFPSLIDFAMILKSHKYHFPIEHLTIQQCEDFCLDFTINATGSKDFLSAIASQVVELALSPKDFRRSLFQVFYRVGLVGLKLETYEKFSWMDSGRAVVSSAEITDTTRVAVHTAFWRVLGILEPNSK
jgi:hypothetical protein